MFQNNKIYKGFTLAEVLVTLAIIGVVAAMTIPSLIQNTHDKETVTSVKKAYSILSQAYMKAVSDNGTTDSWDIAPHANTGAQKVLNYFAPYLSISRNCGLNGNYQCFAKGYNLVSGNYDTNGGNAYGNANYWATIVLNDGSAMAFYADADTTFGYVLVDINGMKGPNKFGADTFWFYFNSQKIYPMGNGDTNLTNCNRDSSITNFLDGRNCTAWVLQYENVDYLHCDGLNWNTKTSCK